MFYYICSLNNTLYRSLDIAFINKELRLVCENEQVAQQKLGTELAFKLKSQISDIIIAQSVDELIWGNPRQIDTAYGPGFKLDLGASHQITFCNNHTKKQSELSKTDWSKVSHIKFLSITKKI